jgi:alpha-L-fucosidase 2
MLTLAILAAALAAGPACAKPTPSPSSGNYITPGVLGDVFYKDDLMLDAYAPEGAPRPAVLLIHGSYGNKRTHLTQLFEPLTRANVNWFSIDYRTLEDVEEAVGFIRCPGRFNITNEMFVIGEDTGGEIALALAARGQFQGVATFGIKLSPQFVTSLSAERTRTRSDLPNTPVQMFHGTEDDESPIVQVSSICKQLPKCVLHAVPGGIHQFENWHPDQWSWKEDLTAWLRGDRRGLWKDIVYARPGGRDLLMDAYLPEGDGPFPAAIIIHGGGWEAGDKVTYVSPIFEPIARSRIAWFSIDYRLTPYVRVPDQLDDVRSAIRFIRQHAERFHIDPNRLAVIGESASGHLAAQIASEPCPDCNVQAVVSFYGVYDFTHWSTGEEWQRQAVARLFGDSLPDAAVRFSPIEHINSGLPPMLLIQGTKDELYPGTLDYAARLKKAGAHYELVLIEGAPHGMENWEGHPEWSFYKNKLTDWLWTIFNRR